MKPYQTIKLTECPDIADIQADGRHSSVGKLPNKTGEYRPYCRSAHRKAVRRHLKRADKAQALREIE
jgi:hypothetical protein